MRAGFASLVILSLSLRVAYCGSGTTFTLSKAWSGTDFLSNDWAWFTDDDPTNGRVNYVSQAEALQEGLAYGALFYVCFPRYQSRLNMCLSQQLTRYFSCVRTTQTSSIQLRVGETVSGSPHRSLGMTLYMCLTSSTCRKAVPPGPPFGRRAQ